AMNVQTWTPEVADLGDRIIGLTLPRASELRAYLEQVHGVRSTSAAEPLQPGDLCSDGDDAPPATFEVRLDGFEPGRKIGVIKAVRAVTSLGLAESKALVENCPCLVRADLAAAEADTTKATLEAAGATVSLR